MHSVASSGFRFVLFVPYNRLYGLGCLDIRFEYSILYSICGFQGTYAKSNVLTCVESLLS